MNKNTQYQADYRDRLKAKGYAEIRGVEAPKELHGELKDKLRKIIEREVKR